MVRKHVELTPLELTLIGGAVRRFCKGRARWASGSLSLEDSIFIARQVMSVRSDTVVEIGTASGFSAGLQAHAQNLLFQAGLVSDRFEVCSYDISPTFYADESKAVGDGAREQLSEELLTHVQFRHPCWATDLHKYHDPESLDYIFIDANHKHPWPTLDVLAVLPLLAPGAVVVLHDIDLPLRNPKFQSWGAKYLFDGLDLPKETPGSGSNIGALTMPARPCDLKEALLGVLYGSPWQMQIPAKILSALALSASTDIQTSD